MEVCGGVYVTADNGWPAAIVEGRFARVPSEVGAGAGVGVGVAAAVAWYASPAGAVMDGLAETLMVRDPAALGVKAKVAAVVPLGVRVVGAKVPERPAAAGVRTTLDGQAAPVGATVRVTALPAVPELEDRAVVKAVAAAGAGVELPARRVATRGGQQFCHLCGGRPVQEANGFHCAIGHKYERRRRQRTGRRRAVNPTL